MANKRYYQFLFSQQPGLTLVNGLVLFGAAGAVSSVVTSGGIQGITKLATGIYKIKMFQNFPAYLGADFEMEDGVTGAAINDGSFVSGTLYQIVTVGNTNWGAVGFDADYTPAVGSVFVATGAGGAGTGQVKAYAANGVASVAVAQSTGSMLTNINPNQNRGSALTLSCYDYAGALVSPANGSQMEIQLLMKNSTAASG